MRLCFIADGRSVHTQRWLTAMVERGFEVHLITNRPAPIEGVVLHEIKVLGKTIGWFAAIMRLRRLVHRIAPDLVHGHYITSYGMLSAFSGIRPLVLTAWGSDVLVSPKKCRLLRWLTGWTLSRADLITADSLDTLEEMRGYRVSARLEQVQWGVDLDRICPHMNSTRSVLNLISLRSWEQNYNINLILSSFANLLHTKPDLSAHLHLLGGGEQEGALKQQASALGIAEQVTFHGLVNEPTLLEIMAQADISISVPTSDATAMSLLESMAAGLPVVVSDLPANRQWIDGAGGRIVPPGDEKALTDALLELAENSNLRLSMGMRNREIIEARASRRVEMDRMSLLYSNLLSQKSANG